MSPSTKNERFGHLIKYLKHYLFISAPYRENGGIYVYKINENATFDLINFFEGEKNS